MRFGQGDYSVPAVEGMSFDLCAGEFVSIISPSGCGKSTLLNIAGDLIGGHQGAVRGGGEEVHGTHLAVGMVFREESTFP